MIRRLWAFLDHLFGTPRMWVPNCRYQTPLPPIRIGKTGIAAARRAARKARNRRRAKRHA
jgi:hypothetical protein